MKIKTLEDFRIILEDKVCLKIAATFFPELKNIHKKVFI
jgi:hypothetical protein